MANIHKIATMVATPITPQQNQMYFTVSGSPAPINMMASYIELELGLDAGITNLNGIALGHDGLMYPPSCLFRQSKLTQKETGHVLQDLTYVNVLDANMKHYTQGVLEKESLGTVDGGAVIGPDFKAYSIFSNEYADTNPTLMVPLKDVFPGSLGQSEVLPLGSGEVEFRFLMESQFKCLQRVVNSSEYETASPTVSTGTAEDAISNVVSNSTTLNATVLGVVGNFTANDKIVITGTVAGGGGEKVFFRNVQSVVPDNGATAGNFTINSALSASQAVSEITVYKTAGNTDKLACQPTATQTASLTLVSGYAQNKDLWVGTEVNVLYTKITSNLNSPDVLTEMGLSTSIASLDLPNSVVVLDDVIPLASNEGAFNIRIVPLYTNIESDWKILSAHLVLVRPQMDIKPQKMVIQNFESVNVQCVPGSSRFMYNYKVRPNTYNVWCIQPTDTNLYGVSHDITKFLYTLDERPLTTLQIQTSSSLARDNLGRCFANSPVYKLKNLRPNRDREIQSETEPIIFPAKLFNAQMGGEDNLQPEGQDRNLRLELLPQTTTENTTVFLFMEKHQVI